MGADDACSDDTQVAEAVAADTAVAPTLTAPTELAWSAADGEDLQLPGSWRPVFRNALAVFTTCVAIAGAVTAVDRHWFTELRGVTVATEVPSSSAPATPDAATPAVVAPAADYSPGPAAEHLVAPTPSPSSRNADAEYLWSLQVAGLSISNAPLAIASGHIICSDMANGQSSEGEARVVMRDIPGMAHMYALGMVNSAVYAYCPEYLGR